MQPTDTRKYLNSLESLDIDKRPPEVLYRELVKLEKILNKRVSKLNSTYKIYKNFLHFIRLEAGNKQAQQFFRVRANVYDKDIEPHIMHFRYSKLNKFNKNFKFYSFVKKLIETSKVDGAPNFDTEFNQIFHKMKTVRDNLCHKFLFLSVSQCKPFKHNYGAEYFDYIQSSNIGIVDAVDKYVEAEEFDLLSVVKGRMICEIIKTSTSHNSLSMSGVEKKVIYKYRRLVSDNDNDNKDLKMLVAELCDIFGIEESRVLDILQSELGTMSLDSKIDEDDSNSKTLEQFIPSEKETSHDIVENMDLMSRLKMFYETLSPLELKILKLRGFSL